MLIKKLFDILPVFQRIKIQKTYISLTSRYRTYLSNYSNFSIKFKDNDQSELVSIIMPTWNRKDSISDSINSALNQSYKNFELIISDDGSTDGTIDFIKSKYSKAIQQKKIILLENSHQGVSHTRNSALKASKGAYIAYLDSDNNWDEHFLRIMVNQLKDNRQFNCAYSGLKIENHQTGRFSILLQEHFSFQQISQTNFIDINAFIHSRQMIDQFGIYDIELKRLVDWDLILRYTKNHPPLMVPILAVNYYLANKLNNITLSEDFSANESLVRKKLND